ncbi:hypothetical protein [Streptomyces sp. B8F3]|uniref:hypothetical protein n=1 Tax=unclassified Streptomyces TaxID=2593676 RepID=UPI00325CA9DE
MRGVQADPGVAVLVVVVAGAFRSMASQINSSARSAVSASSTVRRLKMSVIT